MTGSVMNPSPLDLPFGVIFLLPGHGRRYDLGPMQSLFMADDDETGGRYSVSVWWVDANMPGPGAHSHESNEELFYVLEGRMTFQVGDQHIDAPQGSFLRVPGSVIHDFENTTDRRAGVLNVFIPGGFEAAYMPAIVEWGGPISRDRVRKFRIANRWMSAVVGS